MDRKSRSSGHPQKRRTTLTLSADSLTQAESLARARKVNLSTVISEAPSEGLRLQLAAEHSEKVLHAYKKPFLVFRTRKYRFSTESCLRR